MAKLDVPFEQLFKGRKIVSPKGVVLSSNKSGIYIRARPKKSRKGLTPLRMAWVDNFKLIATLSKTPDPYAFNMATALAKGTNWYYRDVLETAMSGKLIRYEDEPRVTTPTAVISRVTNEQWTGGQFKFLTPDNLVWDNNAFWNPALNPTRITMRAPGVYLVGATVTLKTANAGAFAAELWVNGSTLIAGQRVSKNGVETMAQATGLYYFHANDYVELGVFNSANTTQYQSPSFWVVAITPEALLP